MFVQLDFLQRPYKGRSGRGQRRVRKGRRGTICLMHTTKLFLLGTRLSIDGCYTQHSYLVTPGVAPTVHVLDLFKLLMILLLPTLGRPEVKYSTYVITC